MLHLDGRVVKDGLGVMLAGYRSTWVHMGVFIIFNQCGFVKIISGLYKMEYFFSFRMFF